MACRTKTIIGEREDTRTTGACTLLYLMGSDYYGKVTGNTNSEYRVYCTVRMSQYEVHLLHQCVDVGDVCQCTLGQAVGGGRLDGSFLMLPCLHSLM